MGSIRTVMVSITIMTATNDPVESGNGTVSGIDVGTMENPIHTLVRIRDIPSQIDLHTEQYNPSERNSKNTH